jgi:hypothetical protein
MIECIFTIDYEIYGNGEGSLLDLIYEPAERLRSVFEKWNARLVVFVEVAELEMIEAKRTDRAISMVRRQIRELYEKGFELGLHVHPQWYNGLYKNGRWLLDYSEYNLCTLPRDRIIQIIDRSIAYFREVLGLADFTPICFRAGNWLFQPSQNAASVLAERGIRVDSSVYKGGVQHQHNLDYRGAIGNGYYWRFQSDVNRPSPNGKLFEIPIYTQMVPFWNMLTTKRVSLQRKGSSISHTNNKKIHRLRDLLRFRYPLKFDFCRMTLSELTRMMDKVIQEDNEQPTSLRPLVAIGHTKDLADFQTIDSFLLYLRQKAIPVTTLREAYYKCSC